MVRAILSADLAVEVALLFGAPVATADSTGHTYLDRLRANGIAVGTPAAMSDRIQTSDLHSVRWGTPVRAMADSMIPVFHPTVAQAVFWAGNSIGTSYPWHSNDPF